MITTQIFSIALGISSPWFIKDISLDHDKKQLEISIDFEKVATFPSKDESLEGEFTAYDTEQKTWRHLNFFDYKCLLHCRTPRIKKPDGKIERVSPPWAGLQTGFSLMFEAFAIQLCTAMPVRSAAKILNISDGSLWRILKTYVDTARLQEDYMDVMFVGMDETSQKRGHSYVSLFVDLEQRKTLFVTEGKSSNTVKEFSEDLKQHNADPDQVTWVSCDMSAAFIKGVHENLPNARITFDKFHITKMLNDAVDQVRREEAKQQPILKNKRFSFLKNRSNLTAKQKQDLEEIELSKLNLKTHRAMRIRESFQEIYAAESEEEFSMLLDKWYQWAIRSRIDPIKKAAKSIQSHWDGIVSWRTSLINNGILEGLNSVIQAAKAKARDFRNFEYFKAIIFLLTGKLNFNRINPYLRACK